MVNQTASLQSSVVNLLNTIVGAGMLAIPLSFKADGVLFGLFIIVLAGVTSGFGLYLQGLSSKFIRNGEANFFNICSITYPSLSVVFDVAIAIQCFGVGLSYIVLIGDLMPSVVTVNVSNERLFWILMSLVVTGPLALLRNLDSLKYTSMVALSAIGYMMILVYTHFIIELKHELVDGFKSDFKGDINLFKPQSFSSMLSTFSIIVFAYTGHQNMYSIINELQLNSIFNINKITYITIPITGLLFISIGLSGYFTFGNNVKGNVMLLYEPNVFTTFGKLALALMVLLSFPLMFHPCRISINNILFSIENKIFKHDEVEGELLLEGETVLVREPYRPSLASNLRFYTLTAILLSASYLLALSLSSFAFILSIVGATGSTAISFILPGIFGYKLIASEKSLEILKVMNENDQFEDDSSFQVIEKMFNNSMVKKLSLGLTVWGIMVMILCLYSSIFLDN